ncbi:MAG: alcohol dehydrogenase catalytic domain-containing protein [Pseudomonadales bacterium]|nr:alcohol dehydrogenase catalytic domain-containing protein [Pseudomonadales bacterium]
MKAAVLRGVREQTIEDIETDGPTAKEVVVKVAAAGVCHSDLHFYNGTWQGGFPMVLGHESAGIVEEVGDDGRAIIESCAILQYLGEKYPTSLR